MNVFDPATAEFLLTVCLSLGLLASAALTILSLPWTDREIAEVDLAARQLAAVPVAKVVALSRQAVARN